MSIILETEPIHFQFDKLDIYNKKKREQKKIGFLKNFYIWAYKTYKAYKVDKSLVL